MIVALFFYLFAGICVASAVMVIAAEAVHSVLYLIWHSSTRPAFS
jgi:NADH-quinone oxidoreductase subunit J